MKGGNCLPHEEFKQYLNSYVLQDYETIAKAGRIDYYNGVAIKTDLREDIVNTFLYNRDAGPNTFERVVEAMRKGLQVSSCSSQYFTS